MMQRLLSRRVTRAAAPLLALPFLAISVPAFAADAPKIDTGNTAWMLASTALVLMMTIPGLGLFYAGMVRKKNVLATLAQSFAICCLVTIVWCVVGYSLAFTPGNAYIGDLSRFMLNGFGANWNKDFLLGGTVDQTIPESVYMMFQMTFAIITPALICGAFADRMKFSAMCIFMVVWSIVV
jgi:Amt family ammonium transporter